MCIACGLVLTPPCSYSVDLPLQSTRTFVSMRTMVDVLLELGGDLGRVNIVGNDIVAIAGEAATSMLRRT